MLQLDYYIIVSEWLLFNANSVIFQLFNGENKLIFKTTLEDWMLSLSDFTKYSYAFRNNTKKMKHFL